MTVNALLRLATMTVISSFVSAACTGNQTTLPSPSPGSTHQASPTPSSPALGSQAPTLGSTFASAAVPTPTPALVTASSSPSPEPGSPEAFLAGRRWVDDIILGDPPADALATWTYGHPAVPIEGLSDRAGASEHWGRVLVTDEVDGQAVVYDAAIDGSTTLLYSHADDWYGTATVDPTGRWLYLLGDDLDITSVDLSTGARVRLVKAGPPTGSDLHHEWQCHDAGAHFEREPAVWSADGTALSSVVLSCGPGSFPPYSDVLFPGTDRVTVIQRFSVVALSARYAMGFDATAGQGADDTWSVDDLVTGDRRGTAAGVMTRAYQAVAMDDHRFLLLGTTTEPGSDQTTLDLAIYDASKDTTSVIHTERPGDVNASWLYTFWESPDYAMIGPVGGIEAAIEAGTKMDLIRLSDGHIFKAAVDWSLSQP